MPRLPYELERPTLTRKDWQDAVISQDASNVSGLAISLAALMPRIPGDRGQHPIVRLIVHQMAFLTGNHPTPSTANWEADYKLAQYMASESDYNQRHLSQPGATYLMPEAIS